MTISPQPALTELTLKQEWNKSIQYIMELCYRKFMQLFGLHTIFIFRDFLNNLKCLWNIKKSNKLRRLYFFYEQIFSLPRRFLRITRYKILRLLLCFHMHYFINTYAHLYIGMQTPILTHRCDSLLHCRPVSLKGER